jgi:hypothetical protein
MVDHIKYLDTLVVPRNRFCTIDEIENTAHNKMACCYLFVDGIITSLTQYNPEGWEIL